jgi:hypothetical protein
MLEMNQRRLGVITLLSSATTTLKDKHFDSAEIISDFGCTNIMYTDYIKGDCLQDGA